MLLNRFPSALEVEAPTVALALRGVMEPAQLHALTAQLAHMVYSLRSLPSGGSVARQHVELYDLDGHNFGFRSAVLNFNAFARLVVAAVRSLFADQLCATNYLMTF